MSLVVALETVLWVMLSVMALLLGLEIGSELSSVWMAGEVSEVSLDCSVYILEWRQWWMYLLFFCMVSFVFGRWLSGRGHEIGTYNSGVHRTKVNSPIGYAIVRLVIGMVFGVTVYPLLIHLGCVGCRGAMLLFGSLFAFASLMSMKRHCVVSS